MVDTALSFACCVRPSRIVYTWLSNFVLSSPKLASLPVPSPSPPILPIVPVLLALFPVSLRLLYFRFVSCLSVSSFRSASFFVAFFSLRFFVSRRFFVAFRSVFVSFRFRAVFRSVSSRAFLLLRSWFRFCFCSFSVCSVVVSFRFFQCWCRLFSSRALVLITSAQEQHRMRGIMALNEFPQDNYINPFARQVSEDDRAAFNL